jgi:hypothetical protein
MTKLSTNTKELRSFGLVLFGASVVLNTYFWWNDDYLVWLSIAGSSLALMAVLSPLLLSPFHWIWMKIGTVMGIVMTTLILTVTYIVMVTPIGLILRIFKKDILSLKLDPKTSSYWIKPSENDPKTGAIKPY